MVANPVINNVLPANPKIIPFKNEEEWLNLRNQGLGGSDIPIIMGLSKFKTAHQLHREKLGQETADQSNRALKRGKRLEPIVIENFLDEYPQYKINRVDGLLVHPEHEYFRGNLDGLVITPNDEIGVFEAKTTDPRYWYFWKDGVPAMYQCQVQYYHFLTGLQFSKVAVEIGYTERLVFDVERDQEAIDIIVSTAQDFWKYVENNEPLPASYAATIEEIDKYYQSYKQKSQITLPTMMESQIIDYYEIQNKITNLETQREELETEIKKAMGEYEIALCGRTSVLWTHKMRKFNEDLFKSENPELIEKYTYYTKSTKTLDVDKMKAEIPEVISKYIIEIPGKEVFDIAKARKENKKLEDKYMEPGKRSKFEVTVTK